MAGAGRPRRGAGRPACLSARQGLRRRPDRRRLARPRSPRREGAGAGRGAALGDARLHRPARRPDRRARLAGGAAEEAPRRDRLPRRGRGRRADVRAAALRRAAARGRPRRRRRARARRRDPTGAGRMAGARHRRAAAGDAGGGPVRAARAERHRLARLRPQPGDDAAHHQPRGGLAQAPRARLRLDLSLRRRPVQHRRRRRPGRRRAAPSPAGPRRTSTCARPSPPSSRSMRRRASWSKAANGRARPARR